MRIPALVMAVVLAGGLAAACTRQVSGTGQAAADTGPLVTGGPSAGGPSDEPSSSGGPGPAPGGTPSGPPAGPGGGPPPDGSDPAVLLQWLQLRSEEVPPGTEFQLRENGTSVESGAITLDLCYGNYPSESHRTARRQVDGINGGDFVVSNELVIYDSAASARAAMNELRSVVSSCPQGRVLKKTGYPDASFELNPIQDTQGLTEDRVVVVQKVTAQGQTEDHPVAYQRRGKILVIVYGREDSGTLVTWARNCARRLGELSPGAAGE